MFNKFKPKEEITIEQFFSLEYLNTFVIAAETKKLNITSEIVYLSHSAVSVQIKKLEQQIGVKLFIRNKDTLTLTKQGEILLEHAKVMLDSNSLAFHSLQNQHLSKNISLGIPTDYSNSFITTIYPSLREKLPNFHFSFSCSRSRVIRKQIEEGKIDFAIVAMELQYPDDVLLWEEPLYWVSSKDFDIERKNSLPIALFSDDCIVNTYTLYCLKRAKIDHEIVFTSTMSENIESAVKNGLAVSLLPASSITEDMRLISKDFLNCPFTLKVGCTWGNTLDSKTLDKIIPVIKNTMHQN
ncbi:LysR family transcriptional regulator [Tetragenococcus halophilus subsp. flandriensis]|uniref:LysR family transcriptional regulator n=1 Tax=Tetragenococcus halophilus TaxID=51669 RepID=UPI0023E917E5|nr:LysR family transcriptional regulator [Tetragenococcus halophilus]GMA08691.1 LysR family transcriptional regulator [Tetragenococcus halophilus subsp. flandriensis]